MLKLSFRSDFKRVGRNVALFLIIIFFVHYASTAFSVLQGIYLTNLGFGEDMTGLVLSVKTYGTAFGSLVSLFLISFLGNKRAMLLATAGLIVSGFLMVNVPVLWVMVAASLLFGLFGAVFTVSQSPFLHRNSTPKNLVSIFSLAYLVNCVASMFSNLLVGVISDLIATFAGVIAGNQWSLNIGVILMLVIFPLLMKIDFDSNIRAQHTAPEPTEKSHRIGFKAALKTLDKHAYLYLVHVCFIGIGAGLVVPFFSMYLKYTLDITDTAVSVIMSISQVGNIVGALVVPAMTRKFGRVKTVLLCQGLSIPFLFSISMPQGIIVMAISFFFRSALMNMASPVIDSMAMDMVTDEARTIMSSTFHLLNNLFRATGIYIAGFMMSGISYNAPYYVTITFYVASMAVLISVFGRDPKYR